MSMLNQNAYHNPADVNAIDVGVVTFVRFMATLSIGHLCERALLPTEKEK